MCVRGSSTPVLTSHSPRLQAPVRAWRRPVARCSSAPSSRGLQCIDESSGCESTTVRWDGVTPSTATDLESDQVSKLSGLAQAWLNPKSQGLRRSSSTAALAGPGLSGDITGEASCAVSPGCGLPQFLLESPGDGNAKAGRAPAKDTDTVSNNCQSDSRRRGLFLTRTSSLLLPRTPSPTLKTPASKPSGDGTLSNGQSGRADNSRRRSLHFRRASSLQVFQTVQDDSELALKKSAVGVLERLPKPGMGGEKKTLRALVDALKKAVFKPNRAASEAARVSPDSCSSCEMPYPSVAADQPTRRRHASDGAHVFADPRPLVTVAEKNAVVPGPAVVQQMAAPTVPVVSCVVRASGDAGDTVMPVLCPDAAGLGSSNEQCAGLGGGSIQTPGSVLKSVENPWPKDTVILPRGGQRASGAEKGCRPDAPTPVKGWFWARRASAAEVQDILVALLVLVALCSLFLGKIPALVATLSVALLASRAMPPKGSIVSTPSGDATSPAPTRVQLLVGNPQLPQEAAAQHSAVQQMAPPNVDDIRKQQQIANILNYSRTTDPKARSVLEGLLTRQTKVKGRR